MTSFYSIYSVAVKKEIILRIKVGMNDSMKTLMVQQETAS